MRMTESDDLISNGGLDKKIISDTPYAAANERRLHIRGGASGYCMASSLCSHFQTVCFQPTRFGHQATRSTGYRVTCLSTVAR
jgi:hypothetical protein